MTVMLGLRLSGKHCQYLKLHKWIVGGRRGFAGRLCDRAVLSVFLMPAIVATLYEVLVHLTTVIIHLHAVSWYVRCSIDIAQIQSRCKSEAVTVQLSSWCPGLNNSVSVSSVGNR